MGHEDHNVCTVGRPKGLNYSNVHPETILENLSNMLAREENGQEITMVFDCRNAGLKNLDMELIQFVIGRFNQPQVGGFIDRLSQPQAGGGGGMLVGSTNHVRGVVIGSFN